MLNRRALMETLGGVAAGLSLASIPALAQASPKQIRQQSFVEQMGTVWSDRGRAAALHAVAAGMDPEHLFCMMNMRPRTDHPRALFELPDGSQRTFGPTGEVH